MIADAILSRFWPKVSKEGPLPDQSNPLYTGLGPCWIWLAAKTPDGYGLLGIGKKLVYAHRLSFEVHGGEIPDGMMVCHRCDFSSCVNPDHLWLGTNQANMRDASKKGRCGPQCTPERLPRGSAHPNSKLNDADVLEIRRLGTAGVRPVDIAELFVVSKENVRSILVGNTWRHLL